jgi:hypothetical protein
MEGVDTFINEFSLALSGRSLLDVQSHSRPMSDTLSTRLLALRIGAMDWAMGELCFGRPESENCGSGSTPCLDGKT